ncbi:DUF805 domain-containing protein [Emcibacter sp. SYSU 3D8]|uniref:DUF805 domain-containing protein n=1 Tax=Emcibacter sp. SYSU 3D8 TaxID=3133969 RepID=UPI0031FE5E3C
MSFGRIFGLVWRGFRMVAVFSGRDTRSQFWSYAIFLYLALTMAQIAVTVPLIYGVMERRTELSVGHPELLAAEPDFNRLIPWGIAASAGFCLLLAGAVTRRLHDRGLGGAWGLMALPPMLIVLVVMLARAGTKGPNRYGDDPAAP